MADSLLVGAVSNGEYKKTQASQDATKANETVSTSKTESKRDTGYNKDMFLQLLVAEMQYQDPLEPTDNSQYVAQLASFTQIEAIQAVQENMETIQSNSLVGRVVTLMVDGQEVSGKVDFIQKDEKRGTLLSIGGKLYEMSKMTSVIDTDYYNAKYLANLLTEAIKKLPNPEEVTVRDEQKISEALEIYNAMNDYDRSFVDEDIMKKFNGVISQYNKLMEADAEAKKAEAAEKTEETEKVEETEKETDKTDKEEPTEVENIENTEQSQESVEEVEETIANPEVQAPQETEEVPTEEDETEISGAEEI